MERCSFAFSSLVALLVSSDVLQLQQGAQLAGDLGRFRLVSGRHAALGDFPLFSFPWQSEQLMGSPRSQPLIDVPEMSTSKKLINLNLKMGVL